MNSFIHKLSQAVNQKRSNSRWTAQVAIALSFVAIALGYLVNGSITATQAADSSKVSVTKPTEHTIVYIDQGFINQNRLNIEWSYSDWNGNQVVDISVQSLAADGTWENLGAPIVTNLAMDSNPDAYVWSLPNDASLLGEQRRISVTVKHAGAYYTNYSAVFHIRQTGLHFVSPLAGDHWQVGRTQEIKFYWSELAKPIGNVWAVLSYRDADGVYQVVEDPDGRRAEMFYHDLPYDQTTDLNYWWWVVPAAADDFISQLKLELFVDDNGDGSYSYLFKSALSGEFTIGTPHVDFELLDVRPVLPGEYFRKDEMMHLDVDLRFSGDRSLFVRPVNLIISRVFLSDDTPDSMAVGDPPQGLVLAVLIRPDEFDADGRATVSTIDFPILSKYLLTKGVIDAEDYYFEIDEMNNFWPKQPFVTPPIFTLDGYYEVAYRLTTAATDIKVGDEFDVQVVLDLGEHQTGGAKYSVKFDPTYLEAISVTGNLWINPVAEFDNTLGKAWGEGYVEMNDMNGDKIPDNPMTGDGIVIATIKFKALANTAETVIDFSRNAAGELVDNSVKEMTHNVEILDVGIPLPIMIGSAPAQPLSGTYFSSIFDLDADEPAPIGIQSLGSLTANYGKPDGAGIIFGIQLFNGAGEALPGSNGANYHTLNITAPNAPFDLDAQFGQYIWFSQINQVRFVIVMNTDNYQDSARLPWVESLQFNYELNAAEVGYINFVGETSKTAAQGASVDYTLVAMPLADSGTGFVRAVLSVDWNGASAGYGTKPTGMTVQFIIDGETSNDTGNIYEFWLDSSNENFRAEGYPFMLRLTPSATTPPADYSFKVAGEVFNDPSRTLRATATTGVLTVTGTGPGTGDFELSFVGESSKSVRPGDGVTYLIAVKSLNNFTDQVTLTTNISSQFTPATAVTAQFVPSNVVTPAGGAGNTVLFNVGVAAGTGNQSHGFTITGTAGSATHTLSTGVLNISDQAPERPAITIVATVPTTPARGTSEPRFYFRLYPTGATSRAARVYQQTDILPGDFTGDSVEINVPAGLVNDDASYRGYIRSTRHLWKKSTGTITIDASTTTQSYAMTFPTLTTGNVGPTPDASEFLDDDIINSLDYTQLVQEWARVFTTFIADFNNDGVVNSADLNFVLGNNGANWGSRGDLLTDLPN